MNTFGRLLKISIFGESHGECIGIVVDGCPAGLRLSMHDLISDLERRKGGAKGTTTRIETDIPLIKSGIFNGKTTGAPIMIIFENKNINSEEYEKIKDIPRPGHADLTAKQKFGKFNDYRGAGHFSGRLTAALIAAGAIAKKLLIKNITELPQVRGNPGVNTKESASFSEEGRLLPKAILSEATNSSPRKFTIKAKVVEVNGSKNIESAINAAIKENDSIGGIVECRILGLPPGLGEPFFDSVESLISHIVFSIPAVKGIEFGSGFRCASMHGSKCNDEIINVNGKTKTNNAGGINGGITNGNEVTFRVAVKPAPSISKIQNTINLKTGKSVKISIKGRHDVCISLRVPPLLEAISALVFADLMLIEQKIPKIVR